MRERCDAVPESYAKRTAMPCGDGLGAHALQSMARHVHAGEYYVMNYNVMDTVPPELWKHDATSVRGDGALLYFFEAEYNGVTYCRLFEGTGTPSVDATYRLGPYTSLKRAIEIFDHEAGQWVRIDLKTALNACCRFDDNGELWFPPGGEAIGGVAPTPPAGVRGQARYPRDPFMTAEGIPVRTFGDLCDNGTISHEMLDAIVSTNKQASFSCTVDELRSVKFTKRVLETFIDHNLPFPFDFILFRPHMERAQCAETCVKGGDVRFNTVDAQYPGALRSTYVAMVPVGAALDEVLCFGATTEWPGAPFYTSVWCKLQVAAIKCFPGDQR
jgi:hypothetical protein